MSEVITDIDQVTTEWLSDTLQRSGALLHGRVAQIQKRPQRGAAIFPLELTYSDDAAGSRPLRLILKTSRLAECCFYRDVAPEMARVTGVPRCHSAEYSQETTRSHVLIEDVSATHFEPPEMLPMTVPYAQLVADTLADIHAYWWEHDRLKTDIGATEQDAQNWHLAKAKERFPPFVDFLADRLSQRRRTIYERLLAAMPIPIWQERVSAGRDVTLVHGDAHWWNFLYPRDAASKTIYVIDWENWHVNIGVSDVAYTIALECFPEHRARIEKPLVQRYHGRLIDKGVVGYDWSQCWQDYRVSVLHHLLWPVLWLGELSPNIWWPALECTLLAYDDLGCEDLLG